KNPLFIFVLSGLLPRFLGLFRISDGVSSDGVPQYLTALSWFYKYVCAKIPGPAEVGSFVYSLCFLALMWGICYFLDKKKIYIKDRKSTRLNSSHVKISYAVFCL